ncbi:hypothetical protein LTR72_010607 [Exophiala xenobiotica]|nr:hypothetical protein LTR41_010228 [Exophiala xenobiotica]KAK5216433.1 hypothetical protein LTR72_010607 [Exophiala xenobiotica]KAK5288997.1 hypothetical protein LTR14_007828 [Exophiala xenobiotica]KAK5422444.1 hypothetical protein LTR06_000702 [Exophiala xenobiotica]KAK5473720.1 hypothetical protein LTR55_010255 [Exophiala xenobiotica]
MPHKHKRKHDETEDPNFDLPPTSRARTLSVHQKSEGIFETSKNKKLHAEHKKANKKKKANTFEDDTPKSFARLMAFQQAGKRLPSGLDDGTTSSKKSKSKSKSKTNAVSESQKPTAESTKTTTEPNKQLKILPGERLSEFAARVDQSLPLTSIPRHQTRVNKIPGLEKVKTPLTKHNKRLARLQSEWHNTEAKRRAAKEEQDDELADQREEDGLLWLGAGIDRDKPVGKKKKRPKGDDDVDPWKQLEKKRREEGELRQKNLQDVVLAPPVLKSVKNMFKVKNEGNGDGMSRAIMT